jgi:uncharacterized coiled-coil protein SlyX
MNRADNETRTTNLEMSVAHLQHDLDILEKAVLDNTKKLDKVLAAIERLTQKVNSGSEPTETRDIVDEKPPHY